MEKVQPAQVGTSACLMPVKLSEKESRVLLVRATSKSCDHGPGARTETQSTDCSSNNAGVIQLPR